MRKPKERRVVASTPIVLVETTPTLKEPWWRSIITDYNGYVDFGAVSVGIGVVAICGISAFDVIANKATFKALEFGGGMGSMLVGFAAYKFGDAKRAPAAGTTQTTTVRQTATVLDRGGPDER